MRVITLSVLVLLILGASAASIRPSGQLRGRFSAKESQQDYFESRTEQSEVYELDYAIHKDEVFTTTAYVGGEEYTAYMPSEVYYMTAPLAVVDSEGEQFVAQVLEAYEDRAGEPMLVLNAGGEDVTVPGEVVETETPLTPVVNHGEVTVAEVINTAECSNGEHFVVVATGNGEYEAVEGQVVAEPVAEIPTQLVEDHEEATEQNRPVVVIDTTTGQPAVISSETSEVTTTTATVGGEEVTAFVPSTGYVDGAPIAVVHTEEGTFVAQVLESHEGQVTINVGGGETITVNGEVSESSTPLTPVLSHGEVTVQQVVQVAECSNGENYVVVETGNGEFEAVEGQALAEPTNVIPSVLVENHEEHHEEVTEVTRPVVVIDTTTGQPAVISSETSEVTTTTATVGGEDVTAIIPSTGYVDGAPVAVVHTEEGTFVAQVLESHEGQVTINVGGGETITVNGEVSESSTPLTPVLSHGEVTVQQVVQVAECSNGENYVVVETGKDEFEAVEGQALAEPTNVIPSVLITPEEQQLEEEYTDVLPTQVTVGGEELTAYIPTSDYVKGIPLDVVETAEGTFVAQVLESHEGQVVLNGGNGETLTVEGEVVETEIPLEPVVLNGEVTVEEVLDVSECSNGEKYVIVATPDDNYEALEGHIASPDDLEFLGETTY